MDKLKRRSQLSEVQHVTSRIAELRNALLSENDLFRGVPEAEMTEIGERLPMATAERGSLIYTPGETPEALFLLKAGNVRIYRLAEDGRKLVLATIGPGTAFGEMSLLGQTMTGSFAEAVDDCTVCIMSPVDVEQLMEQHPAVAVRLVQLVSKRLRQAEDQLEQLAFKSVPARLGRLLLNLANDSDEVEGHSHQELADMIGTSRETVSRALVELKAQGLVEIERRCVRILHREALKNHIEDLDA